MADALIAVARGAQYIEKHVTLDPTNTEIRDHSFALTIGNFRAMAQMIKLMERVLNRESVS